MSLALIAGRGDLARMVADAQDVPPLICAYEGAVPNGLSADLTFRLETLGTLLLRLGERGVAEVCFAGGLSRPVIDPGRIDAETLPLVPLFQEALGKGDDGALRVVIDLFERTGFVVRAAHELAPDLLAQQGVYSEAWPDARIRLDAEVGAGHIAAMGAQDVGQACLVAAGMVSAMEDADGTDALIRAHGPALAGRDGILFKGAKPQQTRLADLPTIGPATLEEAGQAGLKGVVIEAGNVLMLQRSLCAALADQYGLVLWAREDDAP